MSGRRGCVRRRSAVVAATEADGQKALVEWMRLRGLFFHSIPNGAKRSLYGHRHEIAMGLYSGASDLFLAMPRGLYAGFYIEMKRSGEKPRAEQEAFMAAARANGYHADWFDSWEEARLAIEEYLSGSNFVDGGIYF